MTRSGATRLACAIFGLMSLGLLVWLTVAVASGSTQSFDELIRDGVHHFASPVLTALAQAITRLGSVAFLAAASVVAVSGLLLAGLRREATQLTWVMAGAITIENALKYSVQRIRPDAFFGIDPTTYSFPSGHSLLSLCFYLTIAVLIARRVRCALGRVAVFTAAALLIATIGLSRVYLGVHYPTDVIGGFLTGACWNSLGLLGADFAGRRMRGS
jgi:membrane-associated phospholipid phosphatase